MSDLSPVSVISTVQPCLIKRKVQVASDCVALRITVISQPLLQLLHLTHDTGAVAKLCVKTSSASPDRHQSVTGSCANMQVMKPSAVPLSEQKVPHVRCRCDDDNSSLSGFSLCQPKQTQICFIVCSLARSIPGYLITRSLCVR